MSLEIVPSTPTAIGITITFMFQSFFSSQATSRYVAMVLLSFIFTWWSTWTAKPTRWQVIFWLLRLVFWPGWGNRLYLKIIENFMRLIFLDGFWFMQRLFGSMIKFLSLAQFPVDPLSQPVIPCLILLLCQFAAFAYYVMNCFIYCTIPSGSPFPPSHTLSYTPFMPVCCIRLLCDELFYLLHNSQWITFPTQSYLVLYSFYASLLHSLIIWWIVLFLTQFPMDHLSHPVIPCLILLLCQFPAFAYYVINCFISAIT